MPDYSGREAGLKGNGGGYRRARLPFPSKAKNIASSIKFEQCLLTGNHPNNDGLATQDEQVELNGNVLVRNCNQKYLPGFFLPTPGWGGRLLLGPGLPAHPPTTPPLPGVGILTHPGPNFYPLPYKRSQKFSGGLWPPHQPTHPGTPQGGGGSAFGPKSEKLCLGNRATPTGGGGLTFC